MKRKLAILQSCYIPWKGYFDLIHDVDVFVFLENVQYTKNDWRNRNQIKTPQGPLWLTVPVLTSDKMTQKINEARIKPETGWQRKHWRSIQQSYSKAPFFKELSPLFEEVYLGKTWDRLSPLNIELTTRIIKLLDIKTEIVHSDQLLIDFDESNEGRRTDRVIAICQALGANYYLSGPAAKDYIETEKFDAHGIELAFKEYSYPEYPQLYPPFVHSVSVIDLLFNVGKNSPRYIWGEQS